MISVVMPAHNEQDLLEQAVTSVVEGLRSGPEDFEVIVVENGSSDSTASLAARLAEEHEVVRSTSLGEADYGAALRRGFMEAKGDVVVNFDVDLVDLDFMGRALELIRASDAVVVVGSKRNPEAADNRSAGRRLVTAVFSGVLKYGFGLQVSDTHGLKALRREPLADLVGRCRHSQEIFDTELILRAERAGLEVTELPVVIEEQRPPRSSIVSRIPRSLRGLLILRLMFWREGVSGRAS